MAVLKATLQNLKSNGLVGGKLHINRDENLYMLVRNSTHETLCQWNKHTGVVWVLGELAWPGYRVDWEATHRKAYKTLLPLKQLA